MVTSDFYDFKKLQKKQNERKTFPQIRQGYFCQLKFLSYPLRSLHELDIILATWLVNNGYCLQFNKIYCEQRKKNTEK